MRKSIVLLAALGAVLLFPDVSDAKLGDRIRARREARQQKTSTGNPLITGSGNILAPPTSTVQLPPGLATNRCVRGPDGNCLTHPKVTAPEVPAKNAGVDSAAAALAAAEQNLLETTAAGEQDVLHKQEALRLAIVAQNQADARESLELKQEIDDRNDRLESLQPKQE